MRPQLVLDCGGRALSGMLVTTDGQLVPCSQEIRQIATRHVSTSVLFDPRIAEDPDFLWDDVLETLSKSSAHNFFQRTRRIGLRRPWDPQATADALQLAQPLKVLSSPIAWSDRIAGPSLPSVAMALLDALLDPTFAFLADRQIAFGDVDPLVVVPARTARRARLVLQKLFRRRGFRPLTIVRRELAAAMTAIATPEREYVVLDASDDELHVHRVAIGGDVSMRRFDTVASATIRDLGWNQWLSRIALALHTTPSSSFDRALTTLLTGSPDALPSHATHGALESVLDSTWVDIQRKDVTARLREALASIGATALPMIFTGEIFSLDAVLRAFSENASRNAPILDQSVHAVAQALLWLHGDESRELVLTTGGSLRVDTFHGEAIEIVPRAQLPAAGEACRLENAFQFGGDGADRSFLMHLQWGADPSPEGNATLCAMPLALRGGHDDELRLTVDLRRSRGGGRLHGAIEARLTGAATAATRMHFTEELEVRR